MTAAADRLIVALDTPTLDEAEAIVARLRPVVRWFKVGSELFTAAGPEALRMVHRYDASVFLDLKWHDIPNTVASAVQSAARLGVAMMNVHTSAGEAALRAAADAAKSVHLAGGRRAFLIGVTVLTSDRADVERVTATARLAEACGLHGVVASAREAAAIKAACGERFLVVAPGIRAGTIPGDDQHRTATPAEAIRMGADYLVVGRPVTRASDIRAAAEAILAEVAGAAGEKTNKDGGDAAAVRLTP